MITMLHAVAGDEFPSIPSAADNPKEHEGEQNQGAKRHRG